MDALWASQMQAVSLFFDGINDAHHGSDGTPIRCPAGLPPLPRTCAFELRKARWWADRIQIHATPFEAAIYPAICFSSCSAVLPSSAPARLEWRVGILLNS